MVKEKHILVLWWGKDFSSKTRMFTGPHSSLIPHSIKAGSPGSRSTSYFWSHLMLNSPGDHPLLCQLRSHVHFFPLQVSPNNFFLVPFTSALLYLISNGLRYFLLSPDEQLCNVTPCFQPPPHTSRLPHHLLLTNTAGIFLYKSHLPTLLFSFITLVWYIDRNKQLHFLVAMTLVCITMVLPMPALLTYSN